ncbi:hypothetical protein EON66_02970, partial [archaeon]
MCQFIAKTFSALLSTKEKQDEQAYQLQVRERQARLFEHVSNTPNFIEGLYQKTPTLMDVFDCGGAAICFDGKVLTLGTTPSPPQIEELLVWLHIGLQPHQQLFNLGWA